MPQPLARIVDQLKREPSRTGSIVITVFGDAIVPRGGSVWLGTLLEFFKTIDIDSSVVRTAMSRLAAEFPRGGVILFMLFLARFEGDGPDFHYRPGAP